MLFPHGHSRGGTTILTGIIPEAHDSLPEWTGPKCINDSGEVVLVPVTSGGVSRQVSENAQADCSAICFIELSEQGMSGPNGALLE